LSSKFSIPLHPHLFRSTCATWLVDKGILKDYTELIEFFGWAYGTTIPNDYLNRSRIKLKHIDENVKSSRFEELKQELERQKEINQIQRIRSEEKNIEFEDVLKHYEQRIKDIEASNAQLVSLSGKLTQGFRELIASQEAGENGITIITEEKNKKKK
jgi:hypothetical protein